VTYNTKSDNRTLKDKIEPFVGYRIQETSSEKDHRFKRKFHPRTDQDDPEGGRATALRFL